MVVRLLLAIVPILAGAQAWLGNFACENVVRFGSQADVEECFQNRFSDEMSELFLRCARNSHPTRAYTVLQDYCQDESFQDEIDDCMSQDESISAVTKRVAYRRLRACLDWISRSVPDASSESVEDTASIRKRDIENNEIDEIINKGPDTVEGNNIPEVSANKEDNFVNSNDIPPEIPNEPKIPEKPEGPEETVKLEEPERHEEPEKHEDPEIIEEPEKHEDPEIIEEPEKHEEPENIEKPEKHEDPEIIEEPEKHEDPEIIEEPEKHEDPEIIEEPEKHEDPEIIEEPEKHEDSESQEEPQQPELPEDGQSDENEDEDISNESEPEVSEEDNSDKDESEEPETDYEIGPPVNADDYAFDYNSYYFGSFEDENDDATVNSRWNRINFAIYVNKK